MCYLSGSFLPVYLVFQLDFMYFMSQTETKSIPGSYVLKYVTKCCKTVIIILRFTLIDNNIIGHVHC